MVGIVWTVIGYNTVQTEDKIEKLIERILWARLLYKYISFPDEWFSLVD
jgi:hypothetical protein